MDRHGAQRRVPVRVARYQTDPLPTPGWPAHQIPKSTPNSRLNGVRHPDIHSAPTPDDLHDGSARPSIQGSPADDRGVEQFDELGQRTREARAISRIESRRRLFDLDHPIPVVPYPGLAPYVHGKRGGECVLDISTKGIPRIGRAPARRADEERSDASKKDQPPHPAMIA